MCWILHSPGKRWGKAGIEWKLADLWPWNLRDTNGILCVLGDLSPAQLIRYQLWAHLSLRRNVSYPQMYMKGTMSTSDIPRTSAERATSGPSWGSLPDKAALSCSYVNRALLPIISPSCSALAPASIVLPISFDLSNLLQGTLAGGRAFHRRNGRSIGFAQMQSERQNFSVSCATIEPWSFAYWSGPSHGRCSKGDKNWGWVKEDFPFEPRQHCEIIVGMQLKVL